MEDDSLEQALQIAQQAKGTPEDNAVSTARELWLGPNASTQPPVTKQDIIDYARADPQQQQNLPAAQLYQVPGDYKPPSTYDRVMDVLASPFRTYAEKTKEAAHHGSEMMSEAGKSLTMQEGRLPINAVWQYPLGALGTVLSPLTGVYETFGEGVTQATGNREIGNRAALTAGAMDPTHTGAFLKGAARSVAPFEMPAKMAPEVQTAVQTAKEVANTAGELPDMSRRGFLQGAGATVAAAAMPERAAGALLHGATEAAPAVAAPLDASKVAQLEAYESTLEAIRSAPKPFDVFEAMQKVNPMGPEGNVKLRPSISQHDLKGPDVQTVESFLNQIKGAPGITQETLDDLALQFHKNSPTMDLKQPISKAEFEKLFPSSKYEKVDLKESADNAMAHWREEAIRVADDEPNISVEELLLEAGVPWRPEISRDVDEVMEILFNSRRPIDSLPTPLRDTLVEAGITDLRELDKAYDKARDRYIERLMDDFQANHWGDFVGESGYTYEDYQRLVPQSFKNDHPENYFEIGVAHPDQKTAYGHYQSFEHPQGFGLAGHVRGTVMPHGGPLMTAKTFLVEDRLPGEEAVRVRPPSLIEAKPNSYLIEEIQSDAQKGVEQTGHLRNIHATVFKAAIQDALEKGFETVYYPTARTIAAARGYKDAKPFEPIYDKEIIKHGLKPLEKIPGVEVKKIGGDYYEINFSPDAKKYILKGPGQRLTNYADGGTVGDSNEYASLDFSDVLPYNVG